MATIEQIINNIVAQLRVLDPTISAEVGTPERKIIETFAERIASSVTDFEVLNTQNDVDTMAGERLDAFLGLFGFGRQQPTRATGTITFSRSTSATENIVIPRGTQVLARLQNSSLSSLIFITTETVTLLVGQSSVDARVECTIPGTIGNVQAGSITGFAGIQTIPGITGVTNSAITTGGIDGENDSSFKIRFKNTVFRNVSGTTDQFLALAVSTPYTTKANVVGSVSRYQEYIQVPNSNVPDTYQIDPIFDPVFPNRWPNKRTSAVSTNPYSKFTYNNSYYLSNGKIGINAAFYRPNVDFVFNNPRKRDGDSSADTNGFANFQPNITFLDIAPVTNALDEDDPNVTFEEGHTFNPGDILLFEYPYISSASRNDYTINNCVDIFIDGKNPTAVSSTEIMPGSSMNFINTPASMTYRFNHKRVLDGSTPIENNRMLPLFWQPVVDIPDSITIGTHKYYKANYYNSANGKYYNSFESGTYVQEANYWLIEEVTNIFGTVRARNGIEWSSTVSGVPQDITPDLPGGTTTPTPATSWAGNQFLIENYYFDENIRTLQSTVERNKQATTDVLVHQASSKFYKLYITVMYSSGVNSNSVDFDIVTALSTFFSGQYFGTTIQMSDLLQVIHNVPGVDNVRWSRDLDGGLPRVEQVQKNGNSLTVPVYLNDDFILKDSELPATPIFTSQNITSALIIKRRAQNTWNIV